MSDQEHTVEELLEWIAGAEHHPGCSGWAPGMRCKCGRREFDLPWGQDPETNGMDNA